MKKNKKETLALGIGTASYILFLLICILSYAINYLTHEVQVDSFSQLLYTIQVGMGGAGNTIVQILQGFALHSGLWVLIGTLVYLYFLKKWMIIHKAHQAGEDISQAGSTLVRMHSTALTALGLCFAVIAWQLSSGFTVLKIDAYLEQQQTYSTLYENEYVDPASAHIARPAEKKNLIYIYMESMEATYASQAQGGGFEGSLIPELYTLAKENTDFSAASDPVLNGGQVTNKTSWTVAGIVAQTSGTPLGSGNGAYNKSFADEFAFLPNVTTLGDILEADGYKNVFMCGSEASYAGRANYFRQHGNYKILDVQSARDAGQIPEDYNVWWGYEDSKLIDFAKEQITNLAASDQPFNFTMLTADTHFEDGYLCPDCPQDHEEQYENVIECSDHRIAGFVDWIEQQPFADNTVIVLAGDHLSMDGLVSQEVGLDYGRRTYAAVVNGPEYTQDKTRSFTTLDLFPTTLEALGYQIENGRLGLGTSLYSEHETLTEQYGFDVLNEQIALRSHRFEEEILKGDGEPIPAVNIE